MSQKVHKMVVQVDGPRNLKVVHPPEPKQPQSLLGKIHAAKTADEVDKLLVSGKEYQFAGPKTRRRWQRAATARKAALANPKPEAK